MENTGKLRDKTIFITGASRGIGKAIALKCAKDGANVVIAAKTAEPHPRLAGTIYSANDEVAAAGGRPLPLTVDVRDERSVAAAIERAVATFGGLDVLVNNASAISLTSSEATEAKWYDLMHDVNARGTFMVSKLCLPYLRASSYGGRILNNSPPLVMSPRWFAPHCAYTMSKYGMSMCTLGMAEEHRGEVAVNSIWPKTMIHTAASQMLAGGDVMASQRSSRKVDIMADAAYAILCRPLSYTGNFCIDEDVLREEGVTDFQQYSCLPDSEPQLDLFLPEKYYYEAKSKL